MGGDGRDLLAYPKVYAFLISRWPLWILQAPLAVVFAYLLWSGPSKVQDYPQNPATILIWVIWWPLLLLSALVLGRVWCGFLCPLGGAVDILNRRFSAHRLPQGLRSPWLLVGSFLMTVYLIGALDLPHRVPSWTSYFFLGIVAIAIAMALFYRGRAWCRYACPIGAVLGLFSKFSVLELRTEQAICKSCQCRRCEKYEKHRIGCPVYLKPYRLEGNSDCILCMECAKVCPNDAVKWQVRPFGTEVSGSLGLQESFVGIALLGITFLQVSSMYPTFKALKGSFQWDGELGFYAVLFAAAISLSFMLTMGLAGYARFLGGDWRDRLGKVGPFLLPFSALAFLLLNLIHLQTEGGSILKMLVGSGGTTVAATGHVHIPPSNWMVLLSFGLVLLGFLWGVQILAAHVRGPRSLIAAIPLLLSLGLVASLYLGLVTSMPQSNPLLEVRGSGEIIKDTIGDMISPTEIRGVTSLRIDGPPTALAVAGDGSRVLVGAYDSIYLFDDGGGLLRRYRTSQVFSAAMSSEGAGVVGTYDAVYIFGKDGRLIWKNGTPLDTYASISMDGSLIAYGAEDRLYLVDRQGQLLWSYRVQSGYPKVYLFNVHISRDGNYIAAAESYSGSIYLFDREGSLLWRQKMEGHPYALSISSGGEYVAVGTVGDYSGVYLFDRAGALLLNYRTGKDVGSVSVSASGDVAAGTYENYLYYFEGGGMKWRRPMGGAVYATIAADGRSVAAASGDGMVYLFDGRGNLKGSYKTGLWRDYLSRIASSANGTLVVAGSHFSGNLYLFDTSRASFTAPVLSALRDAFYWASLGLVVLVYGYKKRRE